MSLTITRALSRIKVIQNRLEDLSSNRSFVSSVLSTEANSTRWQEFKSKSQSLWDEYKSLVSEYSKLKSAIKVANQTTKVVICGSEMTVEEALIKKTLSKYELSVLENVKRQLVSAENEISSANDKIESTARQFAEKLARDNATADQIEKAVEIGRSSAKKEFQRELVIGFKSDQVQLAIDNYNKFLEEVDYVLSESNATTLIEIK